MIETVTVYAPTEVFVYKIGNSLENGAKVSKISIFFSKVTIKFDDGYKLIFKGLPYSIELK